MSEKETAADGYPVSLVGESFHQEAIGQCREGQRVRVLHEIGNPYDDEALLVVTEEGMALGRVGRDCWLKDAIHRELKGCEATILKIGNGGRGLLGVVLDVTLNHEGVEECEYRP